MRMYTSAVVPHAASAERHAATAATDNVNASARGRPTASPTRPIVNMPSMLPMKIEEPIAAFAHIGVASSCARRSNAKLIEL